MKLLLHACCGPCSLEPVRLLQEAGHDLTIAYMNSNIHPAEEYVRRRDTLMAWAAEVGIPVVEGVYDASLWEASAGAIAAQHELNNRTLEGPSRATETLQPPENPQSSYNRSERCRACYRFRFEEAACYAADHGFDGICTTLSVSPYQFTDIIAEELEAIGTQHGLAVVFEDFRPYYSQATQQSRDLGMYRQNYCGCRLSDAEAAIEREERKRARKARRAQEKAAEPSAQTPITTKASANTEPHSTEETSAKSPTTKAAL